MKLFRGLPIFSLALLYAGTVAYYRGGLIGQLLGVSLFVAIGLVMGVDRRFDRQGILPQLSIKETLVQFYVGLVSGGTAYLLFKLGMYLLNIPTGRLAWALPTSAMALIVVTAAAEELFFRGYIQKRMSVRFQPALAIACVSILVAIYKLLIHSDNWSWGAVVVIGGVSMVGCIWTGLLFYWSGSLVAPVTCHVAWDLLVYGNQAVMPYWLY